MDKMKLTILSHTPNPELTIASAGKLCYAQGTATELKDYLIDNPDSVSKFVRRLVQMGHESPLEHASVTFSLSGISRSCSHQIVRHRIASYSQQSQRYVNMKDNYQYVTPDDILNNPKLKEAYDNSVNIAYITYDQIVEELMFQYMEEGFTESQSEKKAIEVARYVLPESSCTNLVFTMNFRSCLNFLSLRECKRAHFEIRRVAQEMRELLIGIAPSVFESSGAPCRRGRCPESKMSCGSPYPKSL